MERFQYKGYVFERDEHCETCSQNKLKYSMNSTASFSFGDKCNHRKVTVIFLKPDTVTADLRNATIGEKAIINRDFNI